MTRVAHSEMHENYSALSRQKTTMERDSASRECAWQASTSQQRFNRDSREEAIGFTDYRNMYTSSYKDNGYDKSCRHTTGYGFHMSRVDSSHQGSHRFREDVANARRTDTNGGTAPLLPLSNIHINDNFGFWQSEATGIPIPAFAPDGVQDAIFPIGPGSTDDICPPLPPLNDPDSDPECPTIYPSAGEGWNIRHQFSIGIPTIGTINLSWSEGRNWRLYFHCTRSNVAGTQQRDSTQEDRVIGFTRADEADNQIYSSERTDIAHLVRKFGVTIRRGTTDLDGEERSRGKSQGEVHNQTTRDKEDSAYSQMRSESETSRHSESRLRKTESARDDRIVTKYAQIGRQLGKLWDRLWDEAQRIERQYAAHPAIASMTCNLQGATSCHCPVRQSWISSARGIGHMLDADTLVNRAHLP